MRDGTELFNQFMDNDSFKRQMTDTALSLVYEPAATPRTNLAWCRPLGSVG